MGIKSTLFKPVAKIASGSLRKWRKTAVADQQKILQQLVSKAKDTAFGKDHNFKAIRNYNDFKQHVPIRDYEAARTYFDRVVQAEQDVLWPGLPAYFAKTSGTTSGTKYIPITKDSIPNHFGSARDMTFQYIAQSGKADFFDGKMIFLSGSPELTTTNGILTGRLSGISNHMIPGWVKSGQMPSYPTNCIEDWEIKVEKIVDETRQQDMRLISGIPPWVQMYFERLLDRTGKKTVLEVFPNFSMFIYGG
ncbi:MAG: GH3 auxin-responsive promoter family protein, partial [Bacteroidota bacterium]